MKQIKYTLLSLPIIFLITACVTLPTEYSFKAQRTFNTSSDIVWSALMQFFTENNIQIKTIEKDSGVIYAERIYSSTAGNQSSISDAWFDCGNSDMETPVSSTLSLNVFVRDDLKLDNTNTSINVAFSQKWHSHWTGDYRMVQCNSTGVLEHTILDYIYKYVEEHNIIK